MPVTLTLPVTIPDEAMARIRQAVSVPAPSPSPVPPRISPIIPPESVISQPPTPEGGCPQILPPFCPPPRMMTRRDIGTDSRGCPIIEYLCEEPLLRGDGGTRAGGGSGTGSPPPSGGGGGGGGPTPSDRACSAAETEFAKRVIPNGNDNPDLKLTTKDPDGKNNWVGVKDGNVIKTADQWWGDLVAGLGLKPAGLGMVDCRQGCPKDLSEIIRNAILAKGPTQKYYIARREGYADSCPVGVGRV